MLADDVQQRYQKWLDYPNHPKAIAEELKSIQGDEAAISDRFYQDLSFGTGGLRGVLGAGTNRMNVYTVGRTTLGLARHIRSLGGADKGVVISYDCRHMSKEFALEAGLVLVAAGVKAYVFEQLRPTPELSYAVRTLRAAGGIMITASHNPPEYNGYKVYDGEGCQVLEDAAKKVTDQIESIHDLFHIPTAKREEAEQSGMLMWVGGDMDDNFVTRIINTLKVASVTDEDRQRLGVVYTPLHGTGNIPVRRVLDAAGYTQVHVVPSQEKPDGDFPTVKSPNPEEASALVEAINLAKQTRADLAMGTDPDSDRVGIAVHTGDGYQDGDYQLMTGNQVGGLLVDFVLSQRKAAGSLPDNGIVFKTVVTSELGAEIARTYDMAVESTLTGFKYIGDRIAHYNRTGEKVFQFGYEESYGYLAADFVRDKDAVQICFLICEMAAFYKRQGKTLMDVLNDLYERVGHFQEAMVSATMPGEDGIHHIKAIIDGLRQKGPELPGLKLVAMEDYKTLKRTYVSDGHSEAIHLPSSDVLKYLYDGGSWLAVRPSGTEPKIKFYLAARASSASECSDTVGHMRTAVQEILDKYKS